MLLSWTWLLGYFHETSVPHQVTLLCRLLLCALQEKKDLEVKGVRELILQSHPNWRVPERRVHKFVKRQRSSRDNKTTTVGGVLKHLLVPFVGVKRAESPEPKDAATAATAISSVEQSPKRSEGFEVDSLVQQDNMDDLPVPETVTTTQDDVTMSPLIDVENVPVIPKMECNNNAAVFEDDNDGKKQSLFAPCEGCVVL